MPKTRSVRSFVGLATIQNAQGLLGTPARVVRAYEEWFSGYAEDPRDYLSRTFDEVAGYDEIVVLRDISFESHCEHHLAPIIGRVHIGYLPRKRVVGISKLARLVDVYAKRFQIQEKMTAEIAACLDNVLKPFGVAVVIEAAHQCMTTRGVHKSGRHNGDEPDVRCISKKIGNAARVPVCDQLTRRGTAINGPAYLRGLPSGIANLGNSAISFHRPANRSVFF